MPWITLIVICLFLVLCLGLVAFRWSKATDPEPVSHTVNSGKYNWESPTFEASGPFFIKPWLQPGASADYDSAGEALELVFHTSQRPTSCRVELYKLQDPLTAVAVLRPDGQALSLPSVANQVQFRVKLSGLSPDTVYAYRIFFGVDQVFASTFSTRKEKGAPFRAIVFGDMGSGSPWQKQIAQQMAVSDEDGAEGETADAAGAIRHSKPRGADLIVSTGDVVYHHGRFNEYLSRFFPVYQDLLSRSMLLTCVGNHDMAKYDPETLMSFSDYPDLMAYFVLFSQPLNGPPAVSHTLGENEVSAGGGQQVGANLPPMTGDLDARKALVAAAGDRYPRMANFSYDYGSAHFLFLDANTYMDWSEEKWRAYVRDDLRKVPPGIWKVVILHQPPFTSNVKHQREQGMRFLADIFEEEGVNLVFCGHAHCYERSRPIKFKVQGGINPGARRVEGYVPGSVTMDYDYDGVTVKKPNGVIYIVTGGGGAKLDSINLHNQPGHWQPWTAKLVGDRHSFSLVDFGKDEITVRQIDINGLEVDRFQICR